MIAKDGATENGATTSKNGTTTLVVENKNKINANKFASPEGYKKTKVGVIPEEWEVVRLGEVLSIGSGKDYKHLNQGNIPVYGTGGKMLTVDNFLYDGDSVCIGRKGTIDKPQFLSGKFWTVDTLFYTHSFKNTIPKFIYFIFLRINWKQYNEASGVPSLSKKIIESLKIPLPPLKEQQKIANILTTWDKAIEKMQKLITTKEKLKKGLMQKLLSGEVRFGATTLVVEKKNSINATEVASPEWEEVRLGDIFAERTKRYKKLNIDEIKKYSELLSVGINSGVTKRSENDAKDNSNSDKGNYKILNPNDIAYNTMRMWQGASGISSLYGIVSPAYTIVYLKDDYCIDFFGFLFKTHRLIFDFYRYSQGLTSDTWNLKYPHFSEIKVKIPKSKQEQQKIAQVLTTADKEIELLKKELEELKKQKKGLMQKLLSGEVRVRV